MPSTEPTCAPYDPAHLSILANRALSGVHRFASTCCILICCRPATPLPSCGHASLEASKRQMLQAADCDALISGCGSRLYLSRSGGSFEFSNLGSADPFRSTSKIGTRWTLTARHPQLHMPGRSGSRGAIQDWRRPALTADTDRRPQRPPRPTRASVALAS